MAVAVTGGIPQPALRRHVGFMVAAGPSSLPRPPRRARGWAPRTPRAPQRPAVPRQPEGGRFSLSAVDTRRSSLVAGNEASSLGSADPDAARRGTASRPAPGQIIRAYVALCKPRIIELLLITAVPVLFLADRGLPSLLDAAVVVVGGTLAAGSANALNCYIDRDIDQVMRRTRGRPLATHTVSPRAALIFGTVLGAVSVALFAAAANLLAAALTLGAILYYVVVYTMLLKRRTS